MNIDGVQFMAKFSVFGKVPDVKSTIEPNITACLAQIGCKEMDWAHFDPDWVYKQFLNYKDLTITIKGKDTK